MATLGWPKRATPPNANLGTQVIHTATDMASRLRGFGSVRTLSRLTWAVSILGGAIVALLALRVWLQLMGDTANGGVLGLAYSLSGTLASPFKSFEPSTPIRDNGILEFSTLVAIEAYLIATMLALTVLFSARLALMAAPRVVHRRRPVAATEKALAAIPEPPQA